MTLSASSRKPYRSHKRAKNERLTAEQLPIPRGARGHINEEDALASMISSRSASQFQCIVRWPVSCGQQTLGVAFTCTDGQLDAEAPQRDAHHYQQRQARHILAHRHGLPLGDRRQRNRASADAPRRSSASPTSPPLSGRLLTP